MTVWIVVDASLGSGPNADTVTGVYSSEAKMLEAWPSLAEQEGLGQEGPEDETMDEQLSRLSKQPASDLSYVELEVEG